MKKKFSVKGMFCAACVSHVDKSVNKINGVNKVNVSLLSNCMIVDYDETKVSEKDIINAVNKVGFEAFLDDNRIVTDSKVKNRRNGLITSLVLMFILLYVSMEPMIGLPIFSFISENIVFNGIIQMILLIPILIINRNFYIDAYKKIIKGAVNMNTLISVGSIAAILYGIYTIIMCLIKDYDHHNHIDVWLEPDLGMMSQYSLKGIQTAYEKGYQIGCKYVPKIKKLISEN
jgi:Cu+-exporting ATPase